MTQNKEFTINKHTRKMYSDYSNVAINISSIIITVLAEIDIN